MYSEICVIYIPVRPAGLHFEVRGPKVSTDCDAIKIGSSNFANTEHRMPNAKRETKSPKQAKPLPLLRANRKQANLGLF